MQLLTVYQISEEVQKTLVGLGTTGILGLLVWAGTLLYSSHKLRQLLHKNSRVFVFYYRGEDDPSKKKRLIFNEDETINDGMHPNECYWKISWGLLRIYSNGRKIYSRFKWDKKAGKLVHTNDPKLPSVMGQYILPLFVPAGKNREIYLRELGVEQNGH